MAAQNAQALRNDYYTDIHFKDEYNKAAMRYLEDHSPAPVIQDGAWSSSGRKPAISWP